MATPKYGLTSEVTFTSVLAKAAAASARWSSLVMSQVLLALALRVCYVDLIPPFTYILLVEFSRIPEASSPNHTEDARITTSCLTVSTPFENCAPSLNPALHYHCCGPHLETKLKIGLLSGKVTLIA